MAHLTLVHDVATRLVIGIQKAFPELTLDVEGILFGAATHDIGKSTYQQEFVGPGTLHEAHGVDLMRKLGVPERRARFAFTHGNWSGVQAVELEDLIVALADNCWRGKCVADLETKIVQGISQATKKTDWEVFSTLDNILQELAVEADRRLAWQAQFPVL